MAVNYKIDSHFSLQKGLTFFIKIDKIRYKAILIFTQNYYYYRLWDKKQHLYKSYQ